MGMQDNHEATASASVALDARQGLSKVEEPPPLSELQFQQLAESMLQIVWSADASGAMDYYNRRAYDYGGVQPGDVEGWKWESLIHPDDLAATLSAWKYSIETGQNYQIEQRLRRADGAYRWHLTRGVAVRDGQGQVVRWIGTATDIHDQKLAEEALRKACEALGIRIQERTSELERTVKALAEQRQRFNDVLDNLPAYVVLLTPDYHISFSNRFFRERFGECRSKRCFEHLFGAAQPCAVCETFHVLRTGTPHRWEWTGPDSRDYDVSCFPFTDLDGSTIVLEMGIDVTERKRAEEALRLAGAHNRSLIEASLDPLVTIGQDGKITDVNAATEAVTGRSRAELIGTDFSEYFTDPEKARMGHQQVFRDGTVKDYALDLRHPDGRVTSVLYNASVYRDQKGGVAGVFAAARDVTERMRAEEMIRLQADQYATMLATSSDGFWLFDLNGKLLDVNEAYCRMSGYTRAELLSLHVSDIEALEIPEDVARHIRKVMETGFDRFESQHRKKTGEIIDVEISGAFWRATRQILSFVRNITERKQAQAELQKYRLQLEELVKQRTSQLEGANLQLLTEVAERRRAEELVEAARVKAVSEKDRLEAVMGALHRSEERFKAIASSTPDHLMVQDRELRYTFVINPQLGLTEPDMVGKSDREILPKEDADRLETIKRHVLETGETVHLEIPITSLKGEQQIFDGSYVPRLNAEGRIDGLIGYFRNVTEQKRTDQALRRMAEELTRSNKDLEQFAYVIAHDLKEPLRMVTGFTGLLRERYRGKLDAKADEYIFHSSDAASRMQTMIDDLLAYSRAGRGNITDATDVGAVLDESLRDLKVSIEESGAAIRHDPLPTIRFNPQELRVLLQNLIGNAVKFKSNRKPEIHIGCRRQGEGWLFMVRDNGIGIDLRFADRIFMIFQRLHTRDEYPGTGIGLAICKKIVERCGGRIWVESRLGEGSIFYFTVPDQAKERG